MAVGAGRGGPPTPTPDPVAPAFRSAEPERRYASWAVGLVLITVTAQFVVALVAAALTGWALTIDPGGSGGPISQLAVSSAVARMVTTAAWAATWTEALSFAALVGGAVLVIRWQTRALANLPALGVGELRRSARLSGLSWFVPGWGLYAPKQTFNDLWRAGERSLPARPDRADLEGVALPGFHSLWWVLWVGANLLDVFAGVLVGSDPAVGALLSGQLLGVVVNLLLLSAGVLLRRVLAETTTRQDARYASRRVAAALR